MKFTKKIVAILLVAVMALSMAVTSFAASSDPNLTAYYTPYTSIVEHGEEEDIDLMVTTADQYWSETYFDTEAAAEAVQWSIVDGSIDGVSITCSAANEIDDGQYVAFANVYVSEDAEIGAASIEAKNPANGATMNFTIVVDDYDSGYSNITCKFYDGDTELLTANCASVTGTGYYGNTHYTSALDGLFSAWAATYGNTNGLSSYVVENYGTCYVRGMTFAIGGNLVEYTEHYDDNWDYYGWQYRVYHNGQLVDLSEFIGADECQLSSGDTVVWKFGKYGDVTFSQTI